MSIPEDDIKDSLNVTAILIIDKEAEIMSECNMLGFFIFILN